MTKAIYSRATLEALKLLGTLIRLERKKRKMTIEELSVRAGISRSLVTRIEKGDSQCTIGAAFEAATVVGVPLFTVTTEEKTRRREIVDETLALLPKRIRNVKSENDDNF